MAVESQISPVRDPTYDRFDFSSLLDRASQPLATLAQGQLAIASRNNERQFEQQALIERENLAQRNRIAEQQNYANLTEQQRLRLQNESDQIAYAKSDYKPDPNLSRAQNLEGASKIQDQKQLTGLKALSDEQVNAEKDLQDSAAKVGAEIPPSWGQVKYRLLNNPDLVSKLTRSTWVGPDGQKITDLINKSAGLSDIQTALTNYPGASTDRSDILSAVDKATADQTQINRENALALLGQKGQFLNSRINLANDLAQRQLANPNLSPDVLSQYSIYHAQNMQKVFGNGQNPGLAVSPAAAAAKIAADKAAADKKVADDKSKSATGTEPPNAYSAHYDALQEQNAHQTAIGANNGLLQQLQNQRAQILEKLQPGAKGPDYASYGGAFGSPGGSPTIPYTVDEQSGFGKDLAAIDAKIKATEKARQFHTDSLGGLVVPPLPSAADQVVPPSGAQQPGGSIVPQFQQPPQPLPPVQQVPNSNGAQMMDLSQPQPQQPPSAQNGQPQNPLAHQVAMSKLYQLIGTNDPNRIKQIGAFAQQSLGINQQQIQQLLVSAIGGDQNATQKVQQIVQQAQSGLGQTASAPVGAMPGQGATSDFGSVAGFGA